MRQADPSLIVETVVEAIRSDPAFFRVNGPDDVAWQIELYRNLLGFLVTEHGCRLIERRCRFENVMRTHRPLEWRGRHNGLSVVVYDRDLIVTLELWSVRWFAFKRRLEIGWIVRQATGGNSLISDDEAARLGRDGARRAEIERTVAFVRSRLNDFWRGGDRSLREGIRFRRACWRRQESEQERRSGDARMRARMEDAIRRATR